MKQPDELAAIHAVRQTASGARLKLGTGGGVILVIWGAVWLVGHLLQALGDARAPLFWAIAPPVAIVVSFWIGFGMRHRVQAAWGSQLAAFWVLWVLFGAAWVALFVQPARPEGPAFIVSLVAFALSVTELLAGRTLVLAGLALFAWDLLLYLVRPDLFDWGMAGVGAVALLAGIWVVRWKPGSTN